MDLPPAPEHRAAHRNAVAVADAAAALGLDIEIREFPAGTRTADDAARAIGVSVGQIVKSLIFQVGGEVVVALVSGPNRLDERRLAAATGDPEAVVARADAAVVREATGFPIGGVPPFAHPRALTTFIDEDLLAFDVVWAAAGTPRHVFALTPGDLVRATGGRATALRRD